MGELGRRPIEIVEIDLPWCELTYGVAPCMASLGVTGVRKCYNSFATCQSIPSFTLGINTLRFSKNISGLPKGQTIFPALQGVSTRAAEINLSGIDPATTALGKRARVTVNLQDFAYHDTEIDKYAAERATGAAQIDEGPYNPADRGTFFAKMRTRQPYYVGKALRVKSGYVGQALADMPTRHYVITEWKGPDAGGRVTITAKDILDLADNDKALCPAPSRGKLAEDMEATGLPVITLTPETVGEEYAPSGRIAIGNEVMTYTRDGDALTITARGMDGSTASTHNSGDLVQQCARFEAVRPSKAIENLLTDYAHVDPAFIPSGEWQGDNDRWLAGVYLTRTITKPTGVSRLIGEICQIGVMVWWDEVAQRIEYRPNRPLDIGEAYYPVTDAANLIEGTTQIDNAEDQRISQMLFWHGLMDPTQTVTEGRNYRRLAIAADPSAEGPNEYDEARVKEIYCPWLGQFGDDSMAEVVAARLLNRYRDIPRVITGTLDIKDADSVRLAGLVEVVSYLMPDDTGKPVGQPMQVNYLEETEAGNRIRFRAETYTFAQRYGFFTEDTRPPYTESSPYQQRFGLYWASGSPPTLSNGDQPYRWF